MSFPDPSYRGPPDPSVHFSPFEKGLQNQVATTWHQKWPFGPLRILREVRFFAKILMTLKLELEDFPPVLFINRSHELESTPTETLSLLLKKVDVQRLPARETFQLRWLYIRAPFFATNPDPILGHNDPAEAFSVESRMEITVFLTTLNLWFLAREVSFQSKHLWCLRNGLRILPFLVLKIDLYKGWFFTKSVTSLGFYSKKTWNFGLRLSGTAEVSRNEFHRNDEFFGPLSESGF